MCAVEAEAGVSVGNAYYYSGSKEELIREFYARNQADHAAACRPVLAAETDFAPRLRSRLPELL
jgi:AcrR family transcriptional regulator